MHSECGGASSSKIVKTVSPAYATRLIRSLVRSFAMLLANVIFALTQFNQQ